MQVFMPYNDLKASVSCLDGKRLGNQVYREALTIIRGSWSHHLASRMWKGYEIALAVYAIHGLNELKKRGRYYPKHYDTFYTYIPDYKDLNETEKYLKKYELMPKWMGNEDIHSSHRSALLYKGWVDLTFQSSPFSIRPKWLKDNGFPKKHEFKTVKELQILHAYLKIDPKIEDSYYYQFGWKEEPEINYVWP